MQEGLPADKFFIVTRGQAEVVLEGPDGSDIVVARMNPGQYFGEIELRHGGANIATIRAAADEGVDVVALDREMFDRLVAESPATREAIDRGGRATASTSMKPPSGSLQQANRRRRS